MQKVLRFLEANVEWFALGIAVLFMGWTAFTYLISRPVTREFMGQQVTPGDIDRAIDTGVAQNLRDAMNNAPAVNFPVEDFASAVTRGLQLDSEKNLTELAQHRFDWQPFDPGNYTGETDALAAKVKQLPTLPAARPLLVATGLDTIVPDVPAGTNSPPNATGKDVILTVAAFTIPWQPLSDQWNKAFGPDKPGAPAKLPDADFEILSVVASRSEKLPDGSWSIEEPVPAHMSGFPPYPAAGDKNGEINYEIAVAKQPELVVAPPIPTAIAGALWKDPLVLWQDQTNAPAQTQIPGQSPQSLAPQPENSILIEVANHGGSRNQPPPRTEQDSAGNPFDLQSKPRPVVPPPPVQAAPPTGAAVAPAPGTAVPILELANPGAPPAVMPVEPAAKIDPVGMAANSPDLCVYIVDDSAQSGKTYKYRIVYKALNPLFNKAPQNALEPKWVDQFDLASPISEASPEIKVPVKTYLFCATPSGVSRNSQYPFEVITWANGQWRSDIFKVNPGDPIGSMDNSVDYSTGWSYADGHAREDAFQNEKFMVTLVDNDNGSAVIRDASQDANSADHKEKLGWVEQPKSTVAQPPPLPPRAVPPRFSPYPAGQGYGFGERGVGK